MGEVTVFTRGIHSAVGDVAVLLRKGWNERIDRLSRVGRVEQRQVFTLGAELEVSVQQNPRRYHGAVFPRSKEHQVLTSGQAQLWKDPLARPSGIVGE